MSAGVRRLKRLLSMDRPAEPRGSQGDPDPRFSAERVASVHSPGLISPGHMDLR